LHNPGEIAPRECFRLGVKIELRILLSSGHSSRNAIKTSRDFQYKERACAHLEGWATGDTEASWFETREDALLTMRVTERDACALPPLGLPTARSFVHRGISRHGKTHYGARFASSGRSRLIKKIKGLRCALGLWRAT